jgi:hypothetical protein
MKIQGYAMHEGQYNLATMFKSTIMKAFEIYQNDTEENIASVLGISVRTLNRCVKEFGIITPYKQRQLNKKL